MTRRAALPIAALLAAVAAGAGCGRGDPSPAAPVGPAPVRTMQVPFADLQQQFVRVVRAVSPRVVQIESGAGLGSGVVFDDHGDVVTNAHVVAGGGPLVVTLSGGDTHRASLVGSDPAHDLAVVHLSGASPAAASFGDSSRLEVGDIVLAMGNPLGLRSSVTQGIVSSLNRTVMESSSVRLSPVIQTSAAINPGNSGGALVDLTGRVVGIPTLAALDPEMGDAQAGGIGFAIPSSTVRQVGADLIASG